MRGTGMRGTRTGNAGTENGPDADAQAAATRRVRFGALPERPAPADLVGERPVPPPHRTAPADDPDSRAARFSCLAADLGL
ncbi:hypothetical protein ABZ747_12500 [Kitasatospora cineracea]|uniref:hypothetical protein n=1 Tax=Kitasatospora cineracea TaxID=88074 RepID=UPI0033DF9091